MRDTTLASKAIEHPHHWFMICSTSILRTKESMFVVEGT